MEKLHRDGIGMEITMNGSRRILLGYVWKVMMASPPDTVKLIIAVNRKLLFLENPVHVPRSIFELLRCH